MTAILGQVSMSTCHSVVYRVYVYVCSVYIMVLQVPGQTGGDRTTV